MWGQIDDLLVQSSARIMTRIANFLPGLLALLVIISITILVTVIIRVVLRRFLRSVDFDGIVQRWGFPELAERLSPCLLRFYLAESCWRSRLQSDWDRRIWLAAPGKARTATRKRRTKACSTFDAAGQGSG